MFATALGVRLVHVWQMRGSPFFRVLMGDSHGYDEWARRIAAGDWIGRDVFYQAPLYPYLLGIVYATAGRHLLLVRVLQAIVGSASCVLLANAAARVFSPRAGLVAGLMLALYAPAIFFDALIQKSVLDVFFVCSSLYLIALTIEPQPGRLPVDVRRRAKSSTRVAQTRPQTAMPSSSRRVWLALGLAMGALALTRENALVFIVVVLAYALVQPGRMRAAALFAAGLAIVLAPVAARNAYVGGGFYITTSQGGPNFYIGNNPDADGTYQSLRFGRGAPEFERQDATELAERALGRVLTPAEVSSYWFDKAADFITARPGAWLKLMGRKLALLWNAGEAVDTESQEAHADYSFVLRLLAVVGHFGILVPLALAGVIVTWSMRPRIWIFHALIAAYAASVVLFYVFARYRYPLVPLLVMFAAAAIVRAAAAIQSARSAGIYSFRAGGRQVGMAAALVAAAIFCNWPMLPVQTMRAVTETNLGAALQAEGHAGEAAAHYERAIALQPDYAPAYNNLGTAFRTEGRLADAVHAYERALEVRRDYPEAHYNLANTLTDEGKPREAAEHFRVALKSMGGSADVHNNLGIALAAEGKADEAVAEFRAAVAADPTSPKSHRNLADALASAGHGQEAIAEFRRAAELAPTDEGIRYDLGSQLLELNQIDAAIEELRAALKLNPQSPRTHNNLGIALGSQGRMDDAIAEFRAALAIDPEFADAKRNLAVALGARKKG